LAKKKRSPKKGEELIQDEAKPANVARSLRGLVESLASREVFQVELAETTAKLGDLGAHERVARAVAG
jgi:hypothetical protein